MYVEIESFKPGTMIRNAVGNWFAPSRGGWTFLLQTDDNHVHYDLAYDWDELQKKIRTLAEAKTIDLKAKKVKQKS